MSCTVHEAAAEFSAEMTAVWEKDCGKHGDARVNFEIRIWDGRVIVLRALTGTASSWHRFARLKRGDIQRRSYPVEAVFCTRDEDFIAAMKGRHQ